MKTPSRVKLGGSALGLLVVLTSLQRAATAADWPQWRGPHQDGKSPDSATLQTWPEGGPELLWKAKGLGAGYATVHAVGDRLYTAGDKGEESLVIALDRATGKEVWTARLGKAGAPGWGGFAGVRATPNVDGDLLVAIGQYGEIAAYSAQDGRELWRKHFVDDLGAKRPEWGYSESALIDGDQVVCTPGGEQGAIVALDRRTGAVKWRSEDFTDPAQYSSIVKAELAGKVQYVQLTMQSVVGIDPANGAVLWHAPRKGRTAVIPTPICHDDRVYVTSGYGTGSHLFEIRQADGKFTAQQVYASRLLKNQHGGVILLDGKIYGYSDGAGWVCQDFLTGKSVWREKEKAGKGALVYAAGRFVLREEKKGSSHVILIAATPEGYREHGRFRPPEQSGKNAWAHPVIVDGRLYLRDQDLLLCYDVRG